MPAELNSVLLAGVAYDDTRASILDVIGGRGGYFNVQNGAVWYQLQFGRFGAVQLTPEALLQPGLGQIEQGTTGVRFRNDSLATPATVTAKITPPGTPNLQLSAAGSIGSTLVAGVIPAAGNIATAGTGFTYTHVNGTGTYVFTFKTAFAAVPAITANCYVLLAGGFVNEAEVSGVGVAGFTVTTKDSQAGIADKQFGFIATAPV